MATEIPVWGLVDTGATECVLSYEVADHIKATPCAGTSHLVDYTGKPHKVEYGKVHFQIEIEKTKIRWPAIVALHHKRREAVWGGCGFLNYFCVTFDGPRKHFTIRLRGAIPKDFTVTRVPKTRLRRQFRGSVVITPDDQDP